MINWQYFPKSDIIPNHLSLVISVFENQVSFFNSKHFELKSDEVLDVLGSDLETLGFSIEKSKKAVDKIKVPVLFGPNGKLEKYFEADALNAVKQTVIEVEAGRAVANYQFLKDLFQASMMHEVYYLVIAVRNLYKGRKDFEKVVSFMDTLYASNRLSLPLKGVLIIGY